MQIILGQMIAHMYFLEEIQWGRRVAQTYPWLHYIMWSIPRLCSADDYTVKH